MTASLLQSELLAFADRYLEGVAEAMDWGADHAPDARARAAFRQTKVVYVTGAVTTVTQPDPLRVLRDLLVAVRLQKLVWEDEGHRNWASPEAAGRVVRALRGLDGQLNVLARRVLPDDAVQLVYELTQQWHQANSERRYVALTRFADLSDSPLRRRFEAQIENRGLLAPIAEASAEVHELRLTSERALFLMNHMPLLLEWQEEALMYNALKLPEVQRVLDNVDRFADTAEGFGDEIATLVERILGEREVILAHFAALIASERESLFREVKAVSGDLLPLAEQLARTADGTRETMRLIAAMQSEGQTDGQATEVGSAFDLREAQLLVHSAAELTTETHTLVVAIDRLISAETSANGLAQLDAMLETHERRLFGYAASLLILAGVVVCVSALVLRGIRRAAS